MATGLEQAPGTISNMPTLPTVSQGSGSGGGAGTGSGTGIGPGQGSGLGPGYGGNFGGGAARPGNGITSPRLIKEVTIAARQGGGNPDANARLRTAIDTAKANNMPAANIERAIQRGTGDLEGVHYDEITYEGYGPGGVAILVDLATDNRNRTAGEFRNLFTKFGGNLAEAVAVGWMF